MIPILFDKDATKFDTQGLGALTDAISCIVTEERNGAYELELKYPADGIHFAEIVDRSIICAIPSPYRTRQPFRVYKISKSIDATVTIYAQHLSYDLSGVVVVGNIATSSLKETLAAIQGGYHFGANAFSFATDIDSDVLFNLKHPCTMRKLLGGMDGSILDVYGGEYEFDTYTVYLWKNRGQDNNVSIRYRKNLTGLDSEQDGTDCAEGMFVYWYDQDSDQVMYGYAKVDTNPYTKWVVQDVTEKYETRPSTETLNALAASMLEGYEQSPTPSIKISFVDLASTTDYADISALEAVDLCDIVHVYYGDLLVDERRKVTKIKTNVLEGRYEEITIGTTRANLSGTISTIQSDSTGQTVTVAGVQYTLSKEGSLIKLVGSNGSESSVTDDVGDVDRLTNTDIDNLIASIA
jgi:phage minor structural protein